MDTSKSGQNQPEKLKTLQRAVLEFMRTTDRPTAKKVSENYGISLRTAKRTIAFLKKCGLLSRTGNNRSGSYIIKKVED